MNDAPQHPVSEPPARGDNASARNQSGRVSVRICTERDPTDEDVTSWSACLVSTGTGAAGEVEMLNPTAGPPCSVCGHRNLGTWNEVSHGDGPSVVFCDPCFGWRCFVQQAEREGRAPTLDEVLDWLTRTWSLTEVRARIVEREVLREAR